MKFARDDLLKSEHQINHPNHILKDSIQSALAEVDIQLNGDRLWDIQVHNKTVCVVKNENNNVICCKLLNLQKR